LEKNHLNFFRHYKLGAIYKTQALNSDIALIKCLKETHWPVETLVYEGKDTISPNLLNLIICEVPK